MVLAEPHGVISQLKASVGMAIAHAPVPPSSLEALIAQADHDMYRNKRNNAASADAAPGLSHP